MKHYANFQDCIRWAVFRYELYFHVFSISIPDLVLLFRPQINCWSSEIGIIVSSLGSLESFASFHLVLLAVSYFVQSLDFL